MSRFDRAPYPFHMGYVAVLAEQDARRQRAAAERSRRLHCRPKPGWQPPMLVDRICFVLAVLAIAGCAALTSGCGGGSPESDPPGSYPVNEPVPTQGAGKTVTVQPIACAPACTK